MSEHERKRLVVGMTGASGPLYGIRLLEVLRRIPEYEVHLVMTNPAKLNVNVESDLTVAEVEGLADVVHPFTAVSASIASGSFRTDGRGLDALLIHAFSREDARLCDYLSFIFWKLA